MRAGVLMVAFFGATPGPLEAARHELSPAGDWFGVLNGGGLRPGDEVVLGAGIYSDRRRLEMNHRGTKEQPVVIRAAAGARVVLKRPDARQNTINMAGCQHLELRGIEITGGAAGIRIAKQGPHMAKFLRFEGLHIHHIGGVAITANNEGNTYEGLVFRGNHIHHTGGHGEAFYLGVNNARDGSTPGYIFHSLVEGNYIHDLKGPKVSQGDGIEIKDGSYGNIVRDNVIHDTNYPGIIVYGTDGKERNVIERNVIWNTGDNGIQAAGDAVIRNNIIFDTGGSGIYARNHQSAVVGNLRIVHNTVVTPGETAVRLLRPDDGKFSGPMVVANNALYGAVAMRVVPAAPLTVAGNAGRGGVEGWVFLGPEQWNGGGSVAQDFVGGGQRFFPAAGSALVGKGSVDFLADHDFNGTKRGESRDIGAYRFAERGNPGWRIGEGFKGELE